MARQKRTEVNDETISQGKVLEVEEFVDPGSGIEQVSELHFTKDAMKLEAFMAEELIIRVAPSTRDDDYEMPCPNVNGINQPVLRGVPTKVKRYFVEILARSFIETFRQVNAVGNDLTKMHQVPSIKASFPFSVEVDNNPYGREWLNGIMNEGR